MKVYVAHTNMYEDQEIIGITLELDKAKELVEAKATKDNRGIVSWSKRNILSDNEWWGEAASDWGYLIEEFEVIE